MPDLVILFAFVALALTHTPTRSQELVGTCAQDPNLNTRFDCACMADKRAEILRANPSKNPTIAEMTASWHCPNLPGLHAHMLRDCKSSRQLVPAGYNPEAFCACYADQGLEEHRKLIGQRPDSETSGRIQASALRTCTASLRGRTTPEPVWGPTLLGKWRLNVEGSVEMRLLIDREDAMRTEDQKMVRHFTGTWQFAGHSNVGTGVRLWATPEPPTLSLRVRHWNCEGPYNEQSPLKGNCYRGSLQPLPYTLVRETP